MHASLVEMPASGAESPRPVAAERGTSAVEALATSLLVFIAPRWAGRKWVGVSIPKAAAVAILHLLCVPVWASVGAGAVFMWEGSGAPKMDGSLRWMAGVWNSLTLRAAGVVQGEIHDWHTLVLPDKIAAVGGTALCTALALGIGFFVLLPFAARPGANKACVRHVARAALLGTGAIQMWGLAVTGLFVTLYAGNLAQDEFAWLSPVFALVVVLLLWQLTALVRAVRVEYRRAGDFPQPHDPFCDNCGYNLTMAPAEGRCPECGRYVMESLGPDTRPGTPWERRVETGRLRAIARQVRMLIVCPRKLYFQTPTLAGQAAAQRWLIGSLVVIAFEAAWIVPGFYLGTSEREISWRTFWGAAAMGLIWAVMGLMMVGIETAGVAAFSRMRGHPVALATAAKVTAFASPLMVSWVILGGAQLLAAPHFQPLADAHHLTERTRQMLLAGSLGFAHIGGLLWYELTVYRGVRAVQFANK
jgi:hypothetical protein